MTMRNAKVFIGVMVGGATIAAGVTITTIILLFVQPDIRKEIIESGVIINAIVSMIMGYYGLHYVMRKDVS